jgi:hypothetical protein
MSKRCDQCSELKPDDAFRLRRNGKGDEFRDNRCIECEAQKRRRQRKLLSFKIDRRRQDRKQRRKSGIRPIEIVNAEQVAAAIARKAERKAEREAKRLQERTARIAGKPWLDPALTQAERFRMRYSLDPEFNLQQRVRASMRRKRRGRFARIGCHLRIAMVKCQRITKEEKEVLGYTAANLKRHLERQFTQGMTWEAFCVGDIHIDHIRPLSMFDLSDDDQMRDAWSLSNLRPLWKSDNLSKRAKRTHLI